MVLKSRPPNLGVTLLELMLALALTGVIMILISMAIELNLRTLESQRTDVERVQLARAVLRHIAADLHNAVLYEPIDVAGVSRTAAGTGWGAGGTSDLFDDTGTDLDAQWSDSTLDIAGSVTPRSVPGLVGSQFELQVDISRLPRVDQYQQVMMSAGEGAVVDIPSDVKTVAYYLQFDLLDGSLPAGGAGSGSTSLAGSADAAASGLVRRELDRAVTAWAAQNGGLEASATSGQMLAPEVNYLEFRYFDGMEWVTEWDSASQGGLPVAVEITIGIDPAFGLDAASADAARLQEIAMADMTDFTYRLVVRLPAARPKALADESLEVLGL